ncbi:DNA repair protein RecN [Lysinibacillus alkalisoli]|uniref:DNA repair protein RecN n=1 Tax=Lysinibacillus alkalisoli TaxID=1911548 RepID=A0A917G1K9_9BACI|nr:DNA repair protein RecN [Lysinibacillus alkalisoli]GGG18216.1 DNA repair protein RecN [Lysinibacillus alkalisoli]
MLRELSIRNFAIIEDLTVSFANGLTVLTGETGAGKSIIIDAVHLLAGGRGSQEFIRHGARKAELGGLFQITSQSHPVFTKLEEAGIEVEEGTIILRRDLTDAGKSICRINGKLVPLSVLRHIGAYLIDIHGQHENQELMDEKRHIELLDYFAGDMIQPLKQNYVTAYEKYRELRRELEAVSIDEQRIAQRIDLYQFQLNELESAALQQGEEEILHEERKKLMNFNKIYESANIAYEALSGEQHGLDFIRHAMQALQDVANLDDQFKEAAEAVSSAFYALEDASYQTQSNLDTLEFDPMRLNEVEERLTTIQTMKRKYGATIEEILTYEARISEELHELLHHDETLHKKEQQVIEMKETLTELAQGLSLIRKQAAGQLSEAIMKELRLLHMEKAKFVVHINEAVQFDQNGLDEIAFYISTNVGEPPKSLPKIASGGELSRMMLALKTIFSSNNGVTSIIFDEVDTGVSGRVAQAIAEKIAAIAVNSQVLCISHLPQVAAMADHHYFIKKEVEQNRTYTSLTEIDEQARIEELSRMMSGAEITDLTLQHAKELREMADERKKQLHM